MRHPQGAFSILVLFSMALGSVISPADELAGLEAKTSAAPKNSSAQVFMGLCQMMNATPNSSMTTIFSRSEAVQKCGANSVQATQANYDSFDRPKSLTGGSYSDCVKALIGSVMTVLGRKPGDETKIQFSNRLITSREGPNDAHEVEFSISDPKYTSDGTIEVAGNKNPTQCHIPKGSCAENKTAPRFNIRINANEHDQYYILNSEKDFPCNKKEELSSSLNP